MKKSEIDIDSICNIFTNGVGNDDDRKLLGNSLFYYCCGKDPTPIVAFGTDYSLYIYADIVNYGSGDFKQETQTLYSRLTDAGFCLCNSRMLEGIKALRIKNAELTLWATPTNKDEMFCLLYIQNDAESTFSTVYYDVNDNCIKPKCICNYRNEFSGNSYAADFFITVEKRVEFIFGYCYNDKYECIGQYKYLGDYADESAVKLYQRMFWYL